MSNIIFEGEQIRISLWDRVWDKPNWEIRFNLDYNTAVEFAKSIDEKVQFVNGWIVLTDNYNNVVKAKLKFG